MHSYMDDIICDKYLNNKSSFFINRLLKKIQGKINFKNPEIIKFGKILQKCFTPLKISKN